MGSRQGFSLIELLIVIAIITILSTVAYPSYQSYIIKTRRSDAQVELIKAQLAQTNLHILSSYSALASNVGLPTNNEYYTFSVVSASVNSYLMKAVAKVAASQINDDIECRSLFIDQNNHHTRDGVNENSQCWQ